MPPGTEAACAELAPGLRGLSRERVGWELLGLLALPAPAPTVERMRRSGVLAVVTAGVYIGTRSLELSEAGGRLRTVAFWQASEFLNGAWFESDIHFIDFLVARNENSE